MQDPRQWLRVYSTTIEMAGSTNSTKALYFPIALESPPLTWLEGTEAQLHPLLGGAEKHLHRQRIS